MAVSGFFGQGEPGGRAGDSGRLQVPKLDQRVLGFAFRGLALCDFEREEVRRVVWNDSSIAESVDCPLSDNIVWIAEAFSDRDNAEMKSVCACFFRRSISRQWLFPISLLRLGNLPGTIIVSVGGDEGF